MRKARELTGRTLSLARTKPRMVVPGARYSQRRHDAILVLQRGPNASTDYYLRPRLDPFVRCDIAEIQSSPDGCELLSPGGTQALFVILCRYASGPWLEALSGARDRLARVAFFMDDDLPGMMRAAEIPSAARGKVALHFGAHAARLSALCSELWVSTPELARRYAEALPRVLPPVPEAEPPVPALQASDDLVVYHGTDVHARERAFVLEVARLLQAQSSGARIELVGDRVVARAAAGMSNVKVTPQLPWTDYLRVQTGRTAGISLAPLFRSPLNDARAPVKAFDAARLGAAGLYADAPAYRGHVRDGVDGLLLPMEPRAWAEAIASLMADPERRLRLASAAGARLSEAIRSDPGLPRAPAG